MFRHVNRLLHLIHTRVQPPRLSPQERRQQAIHALLTFNVMVRQGNPSLAPDALMYTRLILIMARGGLEWQAYKLFARMLDHGITPLPATYAALRAATAPTRTKLLQSLDQKMQEAVLAFPNELSDEHTSLMLELQEDTEKEMAKLNDPQAIRELVAAQERVQAHFGMDGNLLPSGGEQKEDTASTSRGVNGSDGYVTVTVDSPRLTWDVYHRFANERLAKSKHLQTLENAEVGAQTKQQFQERLARLSDEELRVVLTLHRQFRHGDRPALLERVVKTVALKDLEATLERREAYFRHLKKELQAIQAVMEKEHASGSSEELAVEALTPSEAFLTPREQFEVQPEHLTTPWGGVLKKPLRSNTLPSPVNPNRDVVLSAEDIALVEDAVQQKALDLLPTTLLRRYARHYDIAWSRELGQQVHGPDGGAKCGGLHDRIAFFVLHKDIIVRDDVPEGFSDLQLRTEDDSVSTQTRSTRNRADGDHDDAYENKKYTDKMSAFDVFNAVSRYALEAQVVDDKETNKALLRARFSRARADGNHAQSSLGDSTASSFSHAASDPAPLDENQGTRQRAAVHHTQAHEQLENRRVRITPYMAASGILSVKDVKRGEIVLDDVGGNTGAAQGDAYYPGRLEVVGSRAVHHEREQVHRGEAGSVPAWAQDENEIHHILDPERDGVCLETGGNRYHTWSERRDGKTRVDRARSALEAYEPSDSIEHRYKRKKLGIIKLRKKMMERKEKQKEILKNVFVPKRERMAHKVTLPRT